MTGTRALESLLSAEAVRARCAQIGALAEGDATRHFRFHPEKLDHCVSVVTEECRTNYPDLDIPLHSRWRHFVVEGQDLWRHYVDTRLDGQDPAARARTAIDLVFLSVVLDAGAGPDWQFVDPVTRVTLSRSEGLAAATVDLFFNVLVEKDGLPAVTSTTLRELTDPGLATAMQHRPDNPLLGMTGRMQLLQRLADQLDRSGIGRPGQLIDLLFDHAVVRDTGRRSVAAGSMLKTLLKYFNSMWPNGLVVEGVALGDCGRHSLALSEDQSSQLIPFHKLSQWLTWSLIEPLEEAGLAVTDLDQLTGLPEYRNGGLLIDTGVLSLIDTSMADRALGVASEPVVEWRALTVWLLDRIAVGVRAQLKLDAESLPLGAVLQGGTWSAGRRLAAELRDGQPPLKLAIDGTVF